MNNTSIRIYFNFNLKIIVTIFFIAIQAYIATAVAENDEKMLKLIAKLRYLLYFL
jgi:hypothetical protein